MVDAAGPEEYHRRRNNLTAGDEELIRSIVESVHYAREQNAPHYCQFNDINPDDLKAMVTTFKKVDAVMDDSKTVIRRTVLGIIVLALFALLTKGFWANIKEMLK